MLESLVPYLNHQLFPWIISILILGFALFLWLVFRYHRLAPMISQLNSAITLIEETSVKNFSTQFQQLDKQILDMPLFHHQWGLFKHYLRESNHQLIYQYPPQQFFNAQTLIANRINIRFYQTLPNLFIQIGLLFTFLGLLAALYAVGSGLISDDLATLRESLQTLLTAATFKFLTSLSGIFAAILFSWREKRHWFRLQQLINQFNQSLECRFLPMTEKVIKKPSTENIKKDIISSLPVSNILPIPDIARVGGDMNSEIHKQSEQLEQINNNLLITVNVGFNSIKKEIQRLNAGVGVATHRLYKAIHAVGKQNDQHEVKVAHIQPEKPKFNKVAVDKSDHD